MRNATQLRASNGVNRDLWVSEMFGPTFQGEGLSVGRPAVFLRLGHCPLACVWCDTPYTWDWTRFSRSDEVRRMTSTAVDIKLRELGAGIQSPMLVVTGGEPLLQKSALASLLQALRRDGWRIEVETSGVCDPGSLADSIDLFTVSPKLSNSGMPEQRRIKEGPLAALAAVTAVFKFVMRGPHEFTEVDAIVDRFHPARVVVMAEGTDPETVLRRSRTLAPGALARGYGLVPRWHILLWGDARGR